MKVTAHHPLGCQTKHPLHLTVFSEAQKFCWPQALVGLDYKVRSHSGQGFLKMLLNPWLRSSSSINNLAKIMQVLPFIFHWACQFFKQVAL